MIYATTTCNFTAPKQITGGNIVPAGGLNPNFQFASSTCVTVSTEQATSTATSSPTASILNGFTYGELWTGTLLLFICLMMFFGGIINQVAGVKSRARNTRNGRIQ